MGWILLYPTFCIETTARRDGYVLLNTMARIPKTYSVDNKHTVNTLVKTLKAIPLSAEKYDIQRQK